MRFPPPSPPEGGRRRGASPRLRRAPLAVCAAPPGHSRPNGRAPCRAAEQGPCPGPAATPPRKNRVGRASLPVPPDFCGRLCGVWPVRGCGPGAAGRARGSALLTHPRARPAVRSGARALPRRGARGRVSGGRRSTRFPTPSPPAGGSCGFPPRPPPRGGQCGIPPRPPPGGGAAVSPPVPPLGGGKPSTPCTPPLFSEA